MGQKKSVSQEGSAEGPAPVRTGSPVVTTAFGILPSESPARPITDRVGDNDRSIGPSALILSRESESLSELHSKQGAPLLAQITEKWVMKQAREGTSFRFQLEPETLGALRVDILIQDRRHELGQGLRVMAEIVTKHSDVRDFLEGNRELLRETLAAQGLKIDRFSVSIGDPGQSSFGGHPQQRRSDLSFGSPENPVPFSSETGKSHFEPEWLGERIPGGVSLYV